jgi:hypothetical protein
VTETERYATPGAVEAAIAAAARKAFTADHSLTIQERIRLEYFHRFLSRVFSETDDSGWMLKGGTRCWRASLRRARRSTSTSSVAAARS